VGRRDGCALTGIQSPHATFGAGEQGVAKTIHIINGGVECAVTSSLRPPAVARIQSCLDFCGVLAVVAVLPQPGCSGPAGCESLGTGRPLIEVADTNGCPIECTGTERLIRPGGVRNDALRFQCATCAAIYPPRPLILSGVPAQGPICIQITQTHPTKPQDKVAQRRGEPA